MQFEARRLSPWKRNVSPDVQEGVDLRLSETDGSGDDAGETTLESELSVLIVDDERLIRDLLALALEQRLPNARVDTAASLASAIEHLDRRPRTDVIVLDYKMGDMRGVSSVSRVVRLARKGRVVVLSGHVTAALASDLSKVGVAAALTKDVGMSELAGKIVDVMNGQSFFELPTPVDKLGRMQSTFALSKREAEILQHIIDGDRNADIAFKLGISESTVRVHVYHVFKKLGVTSRIEAFNCWNAMTNGVAAKI
ncbi:MAG: response regulator transcription factor [Pikeienuella sp.]|uniref:response regulator transcription factor n=1 Tax=Pikeienuella sp. TaxID=2831957 RepID=UPI00391BE5B5